MGLETGEDDNLIGGRANAGCASRYRYLIIALLIVVIAGGVVLAVVVGGHFGKSNAGTFESLMSAKNIMGHLQTLQNIAYNTTGRNRAAGTPGYAASVEYVYNTLKTKTDYDVWIQDFIFNTSAILTTTNLTVYTSFGTFELAYGKDFGYMGAIDGNFEFKGDQAIKVNNLGCEASDYPPEVAGKVALIMRGNCTAEIKINAAMTANPKGAIIFNDGASADRIGLAILGLGSVTIPVIAMSYPVAHLMYDYPVANFTVSYSSKITPVATMNVIADMKVGRADQVIVVGSHLDSVPAGPGINDNGSGSSLNLELALQLAASTYQKKIKNRIRFCWFGAEELGLLGSNWYVHYLNTTNQTALREIAVNLNFDMIGSPNFIRGVYNGSNVNLGSAIVQREFERFYNSQNIAVQITDFDNPGRSDYAAFLLAGIPAGGLFTGAEVPKTMAQRTTFGGLAGAAYDPCYHQACDNVDNINQGVVQDMARGAAAVLEVFATNNNLTEYLKTW